MRLLSPSGTARDSCLDRVRRAAIREERLRATSGLRHERSLSSWRGRSGRRYVVGVRPIEARVADDSLDAVVIAVARGGDGAARVVDVAAPSASASRRSRLRWLALARTRGATEMHVHLLAEGPAERAAVVCDLSDAAFGPGAISSAVRQARPGSGR